MELLIIGLVLYFGGKWLVKATGADQPYHLCRQCVRISHGFDHCIYCCEHGENAANCERCLLEGKRKDLGTMVVGEYEPPPSKWAEPYMEPTDEEALRECLTEMISTIL